MYTNKAYFYLDELLFIRNFSTAVQQDNLKTGTVSIHYSGVD